MKLSVSVFGYYAVSRKLDMSTLARHRASVANLLEIAAAVMPRRRQACTLHERTCVRRSVRRNGKGGVPQVMVSTVLDADDGIASRACRQVAQPPAIPYVPWFVDT